jgi:hypothetical protein
LAVITNREGPGTYLSSSALRRRVGTPNPSPRFDAKSRLLRERGRGRRVRRGDPGCNPQWLPVGPHRWQPARATTSRPSPRGRPRHRR